MDVKWSGATQDRPPSPNTREGGPWKTYTDDNFEKGKRKKGQWKEEEREEEKWDIISLSAPSQEEP